MRIAGWTVTASASSAVATATKAAQGSKQHIIYGIDASFSAAPGAPVLMQILDLSVSPSVVVWEGYTAGLVPVQFKQGLAITPGAAVAAVLASGGSIGKVNLHGVTM